MVRNGLYFVALVLLAAAPARSQEGFSLFTTDFPPEEFAARRTTIYKAIGANGLALLQGAPSPPGYTRFRQSNEFYYVTAGRGLMTIGDEEREIRQGDLVHITPNAVHSLRPV